MKYRSSFDPVLISPLNQRATTIIIMVADPASLQRDSNEDVSRGKIMAKLNCWEFKQCGVSWEVNGMLRV
jgi:hypothetical protein